MHRTYKASTTPRAMKDPRRDTGKMLERARVGRLYVWEPTAATCGQMGHGRIHSVIIVRPTEEFNPDILNDATGRWGRLDVTVVWTPNGDDINDDYIIEPDATFRFYPLDPLWIGNRHAQFQAVIDEYRKGLEEKTP